MRRVEAIIAPLRLEEVKDRLRLIGVGGMTVAEVKGTTHEEARQYYRGSVLKTGFVARVQVVVVVPDDMVESVASAIIRIARTGAPGDGKIFISPVEEVIRIRTGEFGPDAL